MNQAWQTRRNLAKCLLKFLSVPQSLQGWQTFIYQTVAFPSPCELPSSPLKSQTSTSFSQFRIAYKPQQPNCPLVLMFLWSPHTHVIKCGFSPVNLSLNYQASQKNLEGRRKLFLTDSAYLCYFGLDHGMARHFTAHRPLLLPWLPTWIWDGCFKLPAQRCSNFGLSIVEGMRWNMNCVTVDM